LITLKIDPKITDYNTVSQGEIDLGDILDDETEEVEYQLKYFFSLAFEPSFPSNRQEIVFPSTFRHFSTLT